jgi:hypothetical protein
MLSVEIKYIILNGIMINVVILIVTMLNVVAPYLNAQFMIAILHSAGGFLKTKYLFLLFKKPTSLMQHLTTCALHF